MGPITSLYFVLKVGNPGRFQRTRDIGAFLGLCPKRDQSGETDKELRISKCGDRYLRRLLVGAAQYILGPFGADSALREHGLGPPRREHPKPRSGPSSLSHEARRIAPHALEIP